MHKTISDAILFPNNPAQLSETLVQKLEGLEDIPDQNFWIGDHAYRFSFTHLVESVKELCEVAGSLRAGKLLDICANEIVEKVSSKDVEDLQTFPSLQIAGSTHWPIKKISPGAVMVLGDMFAGKTYYLRNEAKLDVLVRYGEPFEDVDAEAFTITASNISEALSLVAVLSVADFKVGLDSIRRMIYGLSGAALKGGITSSVFDAITDLNNLFASLGVTVMIAANPMLSDMADMDRLFRRVGACSAGAILLRGQGAGREQTYRLTDGRHLGEFESEKTVPESSRSVLIQSFGLDTDDVIDEGPRAFGDEADRNEAERTRSFPNIKL